MLSCWCVWSASAGYTCSVTLWKKYDRAIKQKDAEMYSLAARSKPVDKVVDDIVELTKLRAEQELLAEKELSLIEFSKAPNYAFVFFQTRHSASIAAQVKEGRKEQGQGVLSLAVVQKPVVVVIICCLADS